MGAIKLKKNKNKNKNKNLHGTQLKFHLKLHYKTPWTQL